MVSGKQKWDYINYLEDIRCKNKEDVMLEEAREEILSYKEFAKFMEVEVKKDHR